MAISFMWATTPMSEKEHKENGPTILIFFDMYIAIYTHL